MVSGSLQRNNYDVVSPSGELVTFSFLDPVSPSVLETTSGESDNFNQLQTRHKSGSTLCAPVEVTVKGPTCALTLIPATCLCIQDGELTAESLLVARKILQSVTASRSGAKALKSTGYMADSMLNVVLPGIISNLQCRTPSCQYPRYSSPTCSTSSTCAFTCKSGYKACGRQCIASNRACASGMPVKRSDITCPVGMTHCSILFGKRTITECLNIQTNLESCGGCIGEGNGVDCSTLAGVNAIACVGGSCLASSCLRGYSLNGTTCIHNDASRSRNFARHRSKIARIKLRRRRHVLPLY